MTPSELSGCRGQPTVLSYDRDHSALRRQGAFNSCGGGLRARVRDRRLTTAEATRRLGAVPELDNVVVTPIDNLTLRVELTIAADGYGSALLAAHRLLREALAPCLTPVSNDEILGIENVTVVAT